MERVRAIFKSPTPFFLSYIFFIHSASSLSAPFSLEPVMRKSDAVVKHTINNFFFAFWIKSSLRWISFVTVHTSQTAQRSSVLKHDRVGYLWAITTYSTSFHSQTIEKCIVNCYVTAKTVDFSSRLTLHWAYDLTAFWETRVREEKMGEGEKDYQYLACVTTKNI